MTELLKHITWTQYLSGAAGLAVLYYVIVLLLYFRNEMKLKLKGGVSEQHFAEDELDSEQVPKSPVDDMANDLDVTVNDIADRILVPGKEATKHELLEQLKDRVANFSGLADPGYRYLLNAFIIETAKENCGADFSEDELEEAWDSLSR